VYCFFHDREKNHPGAWHPEQSNQDLPPGPESRIGKEKRLDSEEPLIKRQKNFDIYLEEQLRDKDFAERFEKAGNAWEIALRLTALRKEAGVSQKELARKVGTSQQQISRLESPSYEGHSLSMLRRVAEALGASVHVEIRHKKADRRARVTLLRPGGAAANP
jgi:DNA-binding XRE family transcriptional regulator